MRTAGLVLCGGHSQRMGSSKADLVFGSETMLQRVVRLLSAAVDPIVVVAAAEQPLPALPPGTRITRDRQANRGPLEGLAAGLSELGAAADAAYATSCDVPRLVPPFVELMIRLLERYQIVVPEDGRYLHPLAAVYRTDVLPEIEQLLAAGQSRPRLLFDRVATRRVPVAELRAADPQLTTLENLNQPAEYVAALRSEGLPVPAEFLATRRDAT